MLFRSPVEIEQRRIGRSGGGTGEHARQAQRLETLVPVSRVPIMTAPVEILIHVTGLAAARVCAKHALKPRGMSRQGRSARALSGRMPPACADGPAPRPWRSEEHTSELQSPM